MIAGKKIGLVVKILILIEILPDSHPELRKSFLHSSDE
jgi:hypothetical protein